jgi:hypothetical protein
LTPGYAVTPSKLISAKATIKIPKISCAPSGDSGIAPGAYLFGGYSGYSGAFAGPNCKNGQASYAAYLTINGSQETVSYKGSTLQLLPSAVTRGNAFKMTFKHA